MRTDFLPVERSGPETLLPTQISSDHESRSLEAVFCIHISLIRGPGTLTPQYGFASGDSSGAFHGLFAELRQSLMVGYKCIALHIGLRIRAWIASIEVGY